MSNLLLQKFELLRVTEVGKIILKKKRPLLLARSVVHSFNANVHADITPWRQQQQTSACLVQIRSTVSYSQQNLLVMKEIHCIIFNIDIFL